jgi:hypothetical protein
MKAKAEFKINKWWTFGHIFVFSLLHSHHLVWFLKIIDFLRQPFKSIRNALFEYSSILYNFICVLIVGISVILICYYSDMMDLNEFQNSKITELVDLLNNSESLDLQLNDELTSEISRYKNKNKNSSTMTIFFKNFDHQLMYVQLSPEKSRESLECPLCSEQVIFSVLRVSNGIIYTCLY